MDFRTKFLVSLILCLPLLNLGSAVASIKPPSESTVASPLVLALENQLQKRYPEAGISLTSTIHFTLGTVADNNSNLVQITGESGRGEAQFVVMGADGAEVAKGWVAFEARIPARIALKRIHPGEKLTADMFIEQTVNIAIGQAHDFWGVILPVTQPVENLETRQTILEGQFLTSSAVEKTPDVRRGDTVQIQLNSGNMTFSTTGTVSEPGYLNGSIRVMTTKTKRELVGKLTSPSSVEVSL